MDFVNNAVLRSAKSPAAATAGHRPGELKVRWLGRPGSYVPIWRAMQEFTDRRDEHCADELWMVEHRPVFTLGQAGSHAHVLAPGAIPVVHVDRGGQVTYHGPGQVVLYPLLDLRRARIGIKSLVHRLEESVIQLLREYGINGERRIGAPGVYTDACKIAALGLRVRRGCSLHGLALNVSMDLEPFSRINPCGYQGLQVTQIADHGGPREWDTVAADLVTQFAHSLHLNVTPSDPPRIAGHDHP